MCTLAETPPDAPDTNHVWQPAVFTPSNPFTVTDATTPVAVTVTNTLTELTGGFTVDKTVVDPDAVVDPPRSSPAPTPAPSTAPT